jgi:hypothetical protein
MKPAASSRRLRRRALAVGAVVLAAPLLNGCTKYGATLSRVEDPVMMVGSSVPKLLGTDPTTLVGFAWDGTQWHQIPVQVDERDLVNPSTVLHVATPATEAGTGAPLTFLTYTEPQAGFVTQGYTWTPTYVGVDHDPAIDDNDEITFLSNHTGKVPGAGVAPPAGVDPATMSQVTVHDPLHPKQSGSVFLFSATTATPAGGGTTGVQYTFALDSGDYRATYGMGTGALAPNNRLGPNPEHSSVTTPAYSLTFGDRWLNDGMRITFGGADGTDILERGRVQFPNSCIRSEDTFDDAVLASPYEAGFSANISGPVRAIRSHIGANSGTYTADTEVFYPRREDQTVDLRVHAIPGVQAFDDLTTGTAGLVYSDDLAPAGVPIDGQPDTLPAGLPTWQMVSSATSGSVVSVPSVATDITPLTISRYYKDQNPASPAPCTGDAAAWGQFGSSIDSALPCTDPAACVGAKHLTAVRYRYYEGSSTTAASASKLRDHALTPLTVTVT